VDSGLRALMRDVNFATFGVPAQITVPDGVAVTTRVIWLTPGTESVPVGNEIRRAEPRRAVAIRSDEVPAVPRGTVVTIDSESWRVDGVDRLEGEHIRVFVVPHDQ